MSTLKFAKLEENFKEKTGDCNRENNLKVTWCVNTTQWCVFDLSLSLNGKTSQYILELRLRIFTRIFAASNRQRSSDI